MAAMSSQDKEYSFSQLHGQNVKTDKGSTVWCSTYSGGRIFTSRPIQHGETVVFNLFGSGHVDFGLLTENPENIMNPSITEKLSEYQFLQKTKVHLTGGKIHIVCSESGSEIISKRDHQSCTTAIYNKRPTWITADILFGNVSVVIESPTGMRFHNNTGENIALTESYSTAALKKTNPSAVCFIAQAFHESENIRLNLTPIQVDGKVPSVYYAKIAVSEDNPHIFLKTPRPIFDLADLPVNSLLPSESFSLSSFTLTIKDGSVICENSWGIPATVLWSAVDFQKGLYFLFELYRVKLTISGKHTRHSDSENSICAVNSCSSNETPLEPENLKFRELQALLSSLEADYADNVEIRNDFQNLSKKVNEIQNKLTSMPCTDSIFFPDKEVAKRIRNEYGKLLALVDASSLADHLFQENFISLVYYDAFRTKCTSDLTNAKRDLLSMLICRNIDKVLLKKVLHDSHQSHIYNILFPNEQ